MGNFTPHQPDVLGVEWAGLFPLTLPLSQGIERGQTLRSTVNESIEGVAFPIAEEPLGRYRFYALATVYARGHETAVGEVVTDTVPLSDGDLQDGATFVNASTVPEALNTSGDNKAVQFPEFNQIAACDLIFATTGLFTGRRILKIGVDLVATAFPTAPATDLGVLQLQLVRISDNKTQIYGDVRPSLTPDRDPQRFNLGEVNPIPPGIDPDASPQRYPWSVAEIEGFDAPAAAVNYELRLVSLLGVLTNLWFVRLRVSHCIENRIATGIWRFSRANAALAGEGLIFTRTPDGASTTWSKVAGADYVTTVTSGDAGDSFPGSTQIPVLGVTCDVPTLDGFDVFAPHEGRQMPRGRFNELADAVADPRITAAVLFDGSLNVSIDSMPYHAQESPPIYAGADAQQGIVQHAVASGTPYPFMRFYARRVGTPTGPLILTDSATGGTGGQITRTAFDALPDLTEATDRRSSGWRLIEMHVSPPITFDASATIKKVRFSTIGGDSANYWQVLGVAFVDSDPQATYGGSSAELEDSAGTHPAADLAVMFGTDPPVIAGLRADVGFFNLLVGDDCGSNAPGEFPLIAYAALRWSPSAVANFDYYEVQRVDSFESDGFGDGPAWKPIAKIHNQANASFFDMEWRVQRTSAYRVRIVRTDGFYGPWPLIVTLANQPSLFDHQFEFDFGTLILTSNVAPQMSMAVQAVYDDAQDGWTFPEAETVQIERFFGRDFQAGFKPTERGGSRFTRTVMVNPSRFTPPGHITSDSAFERLRNLAWADLPYVCVKDDLGQRWLATIRVPDGTTRRRASAYLAPNLRPAIVLAQLEVIEATRDPFPAEWNVFQPLPPTEPDVEVSPTHGSVA